MPGPKVRWFGTFWSFLWFSVIGEQGECAGEMATERNGQIPGGLEPPDRESAFQTDGDVCARVPVCVCVLSDSF